MQIRGLEKSPRCKGVYVEGSLSKLGASLHAVFDPRQSGMSSWGVFSTTYCLCHLGRVDGRTDGRTGIRSVASLGTA